MELNNASGNPEKEKKEFENFMGTLDLNSHLGKEAVDADWKTIFSHLSEDTIIQNQPVDSLPIPIPTPPPPPPPTVAESGSPDSSPRMDEHLPRPTMLAPPETHLEPHHPFPFQSVVSLPIPSGAPLNRPIFTAPISLPGIQAPIHVPKEQPSRSIGENFEEVEIREMHKHSEKKRRDEMKVGFDKLKKVLPPKSKRLTKLNILYEAEDYIKKLHNISSQLYNENQMLRERLRALNHNHRLPPEKKRRLGEYASVAFV